jgi:hypothetical protein
MPEIDVDVDQLPKMLEEEKKKGREKHDPIDVYLTRQDSVLWFSTKHNFKVTSFEADDKEKRTEAWHPFYRPLGALVGTRDERKKRWVLSSGPAKDLPYKPKGELYKPTIQYIDEDGNNIGQPIDPHTSVHGKAEN